MIHSETWDCNTHNNTDTSTTFTTHDWDDFDYIYNADLINVSKIASATRLRIIANAKAARAVLRLGLFLAINPPKWVTICSKKGYWRKSLRCNRYGIGLRIRG